MRFAFLTNTLLFALKKRIFHIHGTSKIFSKNFQFLIAYSNNFSRFVDCICSVEEPYHVCIIRYHVKEEQSFSVVYLCNAKRGRGYVCK